MTEAILLFLLELTRTKNIMTRRNSESDFVCWSKSYCILSDVRQYPQWAYVYISYCWML